MQEEGLALEPGLDLVLDLLGAHGDAAEIAWHAAPFAAPHAPGDGAAQGSHRQASGPLFRRGLVAPSRLRPNHDDVLPDPEGADARLECLGFPHLEYSTFTRAFVMLRVEYSLPRCRLSAMVRRPVWPFRGYPVLITRIFLSGL